MLLQILLCTYLAPPGGDEPVLQRPGQHAEPAEPTGPAAEPTSPTPERQNTAVVPLGQPEAEPPPAPPSREIEAAPIRPPPPPIDEAVERPKGPGTAMISVGAVLGGTGIGVTGVALASDRVAPQAWQRAVVVPIALGALCGGAALLIIGIDRHVRTKRWRTATALTPALAPLRRGVAIGLSARF